MSDINYNSNFEEIKSCLLKTKDKEAEEIKEKIEKIFKTQDTIFYKIPIETIDKRKRGVIK